MSAEAFLDAARSTAGPACPSCRPTRAIGGLSPSPSPLDPSELSQGLSRPTVGCTDALRWATRLGTKSHTHTWASSPTVQRGLQSSTGPADLRESPAPMRAVILAPSSSEVSPSRPVHVVRAVAPLFYPPPPLVRMSFPPDKWCRTDPHEPVTAPLARSVPPFHHPHAYVASGDTGTDFPSCPTGTVPHPFPRGARTWPTCENRSGCCDAV